MSRKRKPLPLLENVEIVDAGSEGKAVAKVNERVVFVPYAAPGDIVDVQVYKKRKGIFEGRVVKTHVYSDKRTTPVCEHFGLCGGCKWQHIDYAHQLFYKQKQVTDNLTRIGHLDLPEISPILPSAQQTFYRNKLEYTFSNRRWLYDKTDAEDPENRQTNGLGFHLPGMFDRILDIENCHLQAEPSNSIRLALRDFAIAQGLTFFDVRKFEGLLRNVLIRSSSTGDLMVIMVFGYEEGEAIRKTMDFLEEQFPQITSLMYVINEKRNDTIGDLEVRLYRGNPFIMEEMEGLKFKVGPLSFFQTNSVQAYELYKIGRDFAGLTGKEVVYDLYTGTGTIANFVARQAKKVVGIEYVPSAIEDAHVNSQLNGIENTSFFAGDMVKVLTDDFIAENGQPDVIITDPPRAGMHAGVVAQILKIAPQKVVYISCNPATQARDVALMDEQYKITKVQPVDMFPHTHHVENVLLLEKR